MNINDAIKEFVNYSKTYDMTNPTLMAEFHHTYRVVEYTKDIAKCLELSEEDTSIATFMCIIT